LTVINTIVINVKVKPIFDTIVVVVVTISGECTTDFINIKNVVVVVVSIYTIIESIIVVVTRSIRAVVVNVLVVVNSVVVNI